MKNAKFSNCYTALEGGVFSMKTVTSKITVTLEGNEFKGNMAVSGGAIYCKKCEYLVGTVAGMARNVFTTNYARHGGDIYIFNILNLMDSTSYFKIDGHSHVSSVAKF